MTLTYRDRVQVRVTNPNLNLNPNLRPARKRNIYHSGSVTRGCTIKINLLGFSKFLYHCFLETVRIFTVPNLSYLFGIISEFRLGAKIGDARLWEQKYV